MIPGDLLGLVLFAASLGPGFIFVLISERRVPRRDRSTLLEAAELVSVGAVASTISLLIVFSVGERIGLLDLGQAKAGWQDYLLAEPLRVLGAFLCFIVVAFGSAYLIARGVTRGHERTIEPTHSMWYRAFRERGDRRVRVTAELRDGRRVMGFLLGYTIEAPDPAERQLGLQAPIYVQQRRAAPARIPDDALVLEGSELLYIGLRFEENTNSSAAADPGKSSRGLRRPASSARNRRGS